MRPDRITVACGLCSPCPYIWGLASSSGLAQPPDKATALLKITVPADAVVLIDGCRAMPGGGITGYSHPHWWPGRNTEYVVHGEVQRHWQAVTVEKLVTIEPGKEIEVDLTKGASATVVADKNEDGFVPMFNSKDTFPAG